MVKNKLANIPYHNGKRVEDEAVPESYITAKNQIVPGLTEERILVRNPMTGRSAEMTLKHGKMTEDELGKELINPDNTQEFKDMRIASYLFQRGLESASFLAELFVSKGQHTKETRAFKSQIRFDYELLAGTISRLFKDIHTGLDKDNKEHGVELAVHNLAIRFGEAAEILDASIQEVKTKREKEKGFGIYVDKNGKPYSIFDKDFDNVIEKDKQNI
jgi:hypothetical protein